MWITILSPCRHYANLSVALQVFNIIRNHYSSSEEMAAAYVLMGDVYKICGKNQEAESLHKERIKRGYFKERGAVTTTVNGKTHIFHVGEIPPELEKETSVIMSKLDNWSVWLIGQGVSIESLQCRHSEKLALAYAVAQGETNIILRKNLRICQKCHEASIHISKLEGIKIQHWDRSRVHVMENGSCSCGGYY